MEIVDNTNKQIMYKDIEQGQLYKYFERVFIKTEIPAKNTGKFKAVRLDTGESYEFNETCLVRPVNATLIIE